MGRHLTIYGGGKVNVNVMRERQPWDVMTGSQDDSSLCQRELSPIPGAGRPGVGV